MYLSHTKDFKHEQQRFTPMNEQQNKVVILKI